MTSETLFNLLQRELHSLIGEDRLKLVAQSYDGAAVLSGVNRGVQARIKEVYNNAYFVHCYAHQLNLILQRAASQNRNVRIFFASFVRIPTFFQGLHKECLHWNKLQATGAYHVHQAQGGILKAVQSIWSVNYVKS